MWLSIIHFVYQLGYSKKRDIVITIVVHVAVVVRKKVLLSFLKKRNFKFGPVITATNKALRMNDIQNE